MRIGIIANGYPVNPNDWWGSVARTYAQALQRAGHQVFVFTPDRKVAKQPTTDIPVTCFPWLGGRQPLASLKFYNPWHLIQMLSLLFIGRTQVLKFVRQNRLEFCLAMWALPSGYFAWFANLKLKVPYGIWCLGSDINKYANYPGLNFLTKKVLKKASGLWADGLALADRVGSLSGRPCDFLPTSRQLPAVEVDDKFLDRSKVNFVFVGRLERVKGIDVLIRSFDYLRRSNNLDKLRLYILGDGSLFDIVGGQVKDLGLDQQIFLKGAVGPDDIAKYLKAADWLIIPSRSESIPIVFSEAVQSGLPMIASDVGDLGPLIRQYKIGVVVPPADQRALGQAIEAVAADPSKRQRAIINLPTVAQLFDVDKATGRLLDGVSRIAAKASVN